MGLMQRLLGIPITPQEPERYQFNTVGNGILIDPSTLSVNTSFLGERAALSLPTFYRGTQILTDLAGALPWRAHRGGIHADQRQVRDPELVDPQPQILVDPSPFHTQNEVKRLLVRSLIMRGNAFLWISGFNAEGFPTMAVPVNPDEVRVRWAKDGFTREYEWRGQQMVEGIDFAHIMLPPITGEPTGLGILDAGATMLGYTLNQQDFAGEFFAESATPAGVIDHPGRIDEDEALKLRAQWTSQHAGGRGVAVLSGGVTYKQISINPEQAQFLQTRAMSNQQIATVLGIPPFMLNAGQPQGTASSLTYQNLSQVFEELYRMTLSPVYLVRIEETMQRFLPRGQSVRFDTSELLRTDDANRWAAQKIALDAGILTLDEVRDIEGREHIPEPEQAPGVIDRRAPAAAPIPPVEPEQEPDRVRETADND